MNKRKGITTKMLTSNEFGFWHLLWLTKEEEFHNQEPCKEYEKNDNSLSIC